MRDGPSRFVFGLIFSTKRGRVGPLPHGFWAVRTVLGPWREQDEAGTTNAQKLGGIRITCFSFQS